MMQNGRITLGNGEVELAERRRAVEGALTSSSILPKQHALLGTALNQFWSAEAGVMEVFRDLAKGFEVCLICNLCLLTVYTPSTLKYTQ